MDTRPVHTPWVGEVWHGLAKRVCLVGESHYVSKPDEDSELLTHDIIRDVRDGKRRLPFYTKAAALIGDLLDESMERSFWDRVAFFNFIPTSVGSESTAVPSREMWEAGARHFIRTLTGLQPTHVLSLGQRQWNCITFPVGWRSLPDATHSDIRIWESPADQRFIATSINHPSSRGFSLDRWRSRVAMLLDTPTP